MIALRRASGKSSLLSGAAAIPLSHLDQPELLQVGGCTLRAPTVPDRAGTSGEPRALAGSRQRHGPWPIYLVRGRSPARWVWDFEPTVTRATTVPSGLVPRQRTLPWGDGWTPVHRHVAVPPPSPRRAPSSATTWSCAPGTGENTGSPDRCCRVSGFPATLRSRSGTLQ